jgi:hypothetical protein
MYVELKEAENFSDTYKTWVVGYCLDTDSFFVTNQRHFFWQSDEEFASKKEGVEYFKNNITQFRSIRENILNKTGGWNTNKKFFLEDTGEEF